SGTLLGSAAVKRHDMESFPRYEYWLGDVFVLPEYRGKGIGRRLVAHCIGAARSLGIKFLYLYTPDVQIFYESFGWVVVGRHFHNGEWVTVMRLDVDKV
ncbi:GNAT family N-acetyltransferase, partial [Neisseria meningitidis]